MEHCACVVAERLDGFGACPNGGYPEGGGECVRCFHDDHAHHRTERLADPIDDYAFEPQRR